MKRIIVGIIATATLAAAMVTLATPAQADEVDVPWYPTLSAPMYRSSSTDAGADTVVQLEAPGQSWGIRQVAREFDAVIPGLTIRTTGTCAASPDAVCVRVVIDDYDTAEMIAMSEGTDSDWSGLCTYDSAGTRTINLNTKWSGSRYANRGLAAHELGHALGLSHHRSYGVTSLERPSYRSQLALSERKLLVNWFSTPRYRPSA